MSTPMGAPVVTKHEAMAREIVEDLQRFGEDPRAALSMYHSLCSLLDFGLRVPRKLLIQSAVQSIAQDRVLRTSAEPELMGVQTAGFTIPWLVHHGILPDDWRQTRKIQKWAAKTMAAWNLNQLMTVQIAGCHLRSPLIGMALVANGVDPCVTAQALCADLGAHLMSCTFAICVGYRGHEPQRHSPQYCKSKCLCYDPMEYPVKLDMRCGVAQVLDVLQRFAQYD